MARGLRSFGSFHMKIDDPKKSTDKKPGRKSARRERNQEQKEIVVQFSAPDPGEKPEVPANSAGKTGENAKDGDPVQIVFRF